MFKEIGDRLTEGTMNLSITQKNGKMSVIASFKGVPGLNEALFTGTPAEIEGSFIERLEQPMVAISKFNFDMKVFDEQLLEASREKQKKLDEAKKVTEAKTAASAKKKKDEEVKNQTELTIPLEAPKEEPKPVVDQGNKPGPDVAKTESPEDEETVENIKLSEKQKLEIIEAGVNANTTDHYDKAMAKLRHIKPYINDATAQAYFEKHIKERLETDLSHKMNVGQMKEAIGVPVAEQAVAVADDFNPFADEDDFQL